MVMTDPIADFLTRIRNANTQMHNTVEIPASKTKAAIAEILLEEGFIKGYEVHADKDVQGVIEITLKYGEGRERVISGLKRISKPGLKVYCKKTEIPRVLGGLGVAIISTSHGIMTDKSARSQGLGGEVLCYVW